MRIAVVGSWEQRRSFDFPIKRELSEFTTACRQIGAQIAMHGHRILASSYSPKSAEYQVIQGALDAVRQGQAYGVVAELLTSKTSNSTFDKDIGQFPRHLTYSHIVADQSELSHLYSVQLAHRVVIVGGGQSTYNAGVAALIAGKTIVPVGAFGGAAEKLLGTLTGLQTALTAKTLDPLLFGQLRNPWSERQLNIVVRALDFDAFPRIMLVHGRSPDVALLDEFLVTNLNLPKPIIMRDVFGNGMPLPNKLQQLTSTIDGAIILATPDDRGAALISPDGAAAPEDAVIYSPRARQNVWLEAGICWSALGLDKMLILRRGEVEIPSDMVGIEHYQYTTTPGERAKEIGQFIEVIKRA
ncbi:MAG TPA: TIR domain-containing protein [Ktedonobacterales bacterium]